MYCYIEGYKDQKFYIDTGAVLGEEFNEKLDSFHFIISNCEVDITFKKYQYFNIVSETTTFNRTFVLDNYTKRMVNLNGNKRYEYTIDLQSETKLLETWLCPNRQILHSLVNGQKTLLKVIREVCELYIPSVKVKLANFNIWTYGKFFDYYNIYDINNPLEPPNALLSTTLCPDLQFTKTSLRDVLTTLFQVVGYLPIVREHKLYYMSLRAYPRSFEITDSRVLEKQESNSSDSFLTTLRSPLKQALDNNNIVKNEIIGFRDSNDVFLKQQENLVLTTDLPIESVVSLKANVYATYDVRIGATYHPYFDSSIINLDSGNIGGTITSTSTIEFYMLDRPLNIDSTNIQYFNGLPTLVATASISPNAQTFDISPYVDKFTFFVLKLNLNNGYREINSLALSTYHNAYIELSIPLTPIDLTDIVVEKEHKQALDVDYTNIPSPTRTSTTIDFSPLKDSYYTTLSYTYGGNEISGFSQHWSWFTWYGEDEDTLIDVLWSQMPSNYDSDTFNSGDSAIRGYIYTNAFKSLYKLENIVGYSPTIYNNARVNFSPLSVNNFSLAPYGQFVFEIEYIPFNQLTLDTPKDEDMPIEFLKFDTQESSIIMLDNFSARELDKIKRLGNKVLQIQQVNTRDYDYVQPLNSLLDESIVFSRAIEFYENPNGVSFYNASYVATKDYVLKNFFTALQNKYRAYEYVDKNESVFRQELRKTYVYVDTKQNKLIKGSMIIGSNDYYFLLSTLISDYAPLRYAIVGERAYTTTITTSYKYDLSVVANDRSIVVSHIEPYANHYGIMIDRYASQYAYGNSSLGGYIQKWLEHSETYKTMHRVGYSNESLLYVEDYQIIKTNNLPKVELNNETYSNNFVFWLKDDNFYNVNYYSNVGERLSDCVEFTYYTANSDIKISKNFTQNHRLSVNQGYTLLLRARGDSALYDDWHTSSETIIRNNNAFEFESFDGGATLLIRNISAYSSYYGVIVLHDNDSNKDLDLISVKLENNLYNGHLYLNFSLNDTRTLLVYDTSDKIWELDYKVKLNSANREVESI